MKKIFTISIITFSISLSFIAHSYISTRLDLTATEIEWLKSRDGLITVSGDPYYPPVDYINSKCKRDGIANDIIDIIEKKLNVKFKRMNYSSWTETIDKMKSGELDIISCIAQNEARGVYMNFTTPYLSVPTVIVTHAGNNDIFSMADISKKKTAIPFGYGSYEYFKLKYPELNIISTINDEESLLKVSSGDVDAAITDQPAMSYLKNKNRFENLSIRSETEFLWEYSIASRKDNTILNSILTKAVKSISDKERSSIARNWYDYRHYKLLFSRSFIFITILIISLLLSAVSLLFLLFRKQPDRTSGISSSIIDELIFIRNRMLDFFLSRYKNEDHIVTQKTRAFIIIAITTVGMSLILLVPSLIYNEMNQVMTISIISGILFSIVSLYLTRIGFFKIAAHMFIISLFVFTWIIIFNDSGDLLKRLDSVTFILAFISFTPLIITHKKTTVMIYTCINILIFFIFAISTGTKLGLSNNSIAEYIFDMSVPLFLSGIISYFISSIYMDALQIAQRTEVKIHERNNELASANAELESMYERINEVSNEMVNINLLLSDEKELLSTTFRSMDEAVITTDKNGYVIQMNRAAASLTAWSQEAAQGMIIENVLPLYFENQSDENKLIPFKLTDCVKTSITIIENMYLIQDEIHINVSGSSSPVIDVFGNLSGIVIILRDITNKKKMEAELNKSSKIETLGIFAGGIAHDLNNHLTSILGNISLAKFEVDKNSELYNILFSAEEASMRTRELALQLLSFTKCGEPVKEVTSIKDLIIKSAKFALSGSSSNSIFNLDSDLWDAKVDISQISQVIYNLTINALQAQGKTGEIIISAENVFPDKSLSGAASMNFIKITIQDRGPGIPMNIIDKIFDPFFTTKSEGSGLGLSIVYSIIKKHGGYITVSSPAGEGAQFEIFIPATSEIKPIHEIKSVDNIKIRGRVLIVDDDSKIISVLSKMLKIIGFSIDSVSDGESAVRFYRMANSGGNPYDIVIMDLTMRGGISGDETAKIITGYDPRARIIVSSGYSNDSIIANYSEHGFIDSLQKPYSLEDLQAVISRVMSHLHSINHKDDFHGTTLIPPDFHECNA